MSKDSKLSGPERQELIAELSRRYEEASTSRQRWRYLSKRYVWIVVTETTKSFKRFVDIIVSTLLLVVLSPVLFLLALIIRLYDGGPALYLSTRVGQWGKEFVFPKFRSMHVNADAIKQQLEAQSDQPGSVRFKMKRDPRITPIGAILRKASLDELPQLWCVLKGEMSLVGPRPPLPDEVERYTLAERRRLDIVPGMTGIWQVSGRADIPFDRQVKLDLQYIQSQSLWLDIKILLKTIPAVILGRGAY